MVGGIEYNRYNAPVGYWLQQYALDGITAIEPAYIKADDVIFYFSKRRPSQIREMSDMSQTITRIRDANEFMVAVSVKQRIEACLAVFIKRAIPTAGLGRTPGANTGPRMSYEGKTISPGMIKEMNVGDEIQVVNPQGQAQDAASYVKLQQRMIGAGQGISYEATARDMGEATYSSARQGLIEDGMTYAEEDQLLREVLDEIYETFLISAVLAEKVHIPDFWERKDEYFLHAFIKPPKGWIDPAKEATATKIALQTGQKTFKQIAAENGSDWRRQVGDICEVLKFAREEYGVDLGGVILGQTKTDGLYEGEDPAPGDSASQSGGQPPAGGQDGSATQTGDTNVSDTGGGEEA